jgi:transposase-like protein
MRRKRYEPEEIVATLRQVDVLVSRGASMADAVRQIGVSEVTFYRWRQEFGGLKTDQVRPPESGGFDDVEHAFNTSVRRPPKAESAAMSTNGLVESVAGSAQAARSNIQAGISS